MMRIPGRKLVRRALRPLSKALFPGAVVVGYHRVADAEWDPLGLAVSPEHFSAQADVLKGLRTIVSVGDLAARHRAGEPLDRYAALTFDDGYADFATTVLPILESLDVPATVFVATGCTGRAFWWEEVAALLAPRRGTPTRGLAPETLEIVAEPAAPWRFTGLDQPERRAATARDLCDRLVGADEARLRSVLAQLRAWAGADGAVEPAGAPMSRAQLEALARQPRVEIGAHTVSHGCLGQLAPEAQRAEIEQSKTDLESVPGASVPVFSYPNGSFSAATPGLVEALGFAGACTSREGAFGRRTDRYRIPRIWAPNAGGPEFRRWLGNWVAGAR
jgi:peptidoglycan/xylan/chitin deacetylase (PgdA/CDA1 family)